MVNEIFRGQLTRSSLGRQGFVGELYDVRTESLTSRSLLKSSFPSELIQQRDVNQMVFDYKFTESISDRFELVNVEAELQLSVLLNMVKLEGSGKFLADEKKSEKTVSCSLLCKLQTVSEKFFASFDEIVQFIDLTALEEPQYTHLITEANWGANCMLSLESTYQSDTQKKNVEGAIELELSLLKKWLNCIKAEGKFEKESTEAFSKKDITIKICADVIPDRGWPTTVEGFCDFVVEIPELLKKVNNGKGKPLNYVMIPLEHIRKLTKLEFCVDVVVRKIDESFILSTIYFFEEIAIMKQKLSDLVSEFNENKKYVSTEESKNAREQYEDLCLKESELKMIISNDWVSVRAGEQTLKDLIKKVEKFKNRNLNLPSYEDFLESCSTTLNKISKVKKYISQGITYLGKKEKFIDVLSNNLSCEFIVLVISTEIEEADPELYTNTCCYFLTLAAENKPNTKYIVVDFDFDFDFDNSEEQRFLNAKITTTKCYHLKGCRIINSDLYRDYILELETDFVRINQRSLMEGVEHLPGNRVTLEMACPGFEVGTCSRKLLIWNCYSCKHQVEYGFDNYFYCFCGRGLADLFEYRCSDPKHGSCFITPKSEFLKNALSSLRPLKELNLLVLGQSGVGKSTWINSIVNYLFYESLDDAKEGGAICTIPASLTIYDSKTFKKHIIDIGKKNENEITDPGKSATQYSHTYNLLWEGRHVRIIDTPGLGDTRGLHQDKNNLKNIIDHVAHLKEIHGVCILLKANDNRITPVFSYCLKELLSHLHKSVTKNIVFCFTNARNSFYTPGQTSVLVEKLTQSLGIQKELPLGQYNMFCLDNEAFLFLCSLEKPEIQHEPNLVKSFSQSWEISKNETKRLFDTIKNFKPHLLQETVSLVTARYRILTLTKPIAEISKTIQINVASIERKKEEINASQLAIEELSKKLNHTEIHLEQVLLEKPRTVCTSPSCVTYWTYQSFDMTEIEYSTHCHSECFLKEVTPKTINNAQLKRCAAMTPNGTCRNCGCGWEKHMHLIYSQKRVEKEVINKCVEKTMMKEQSAKEEIERFVQKLEAAVEKYKEEQEIIIQTSVRFGIFLQKNAISFYNDSVAEYLEYMIKEEQNKPFKSIMEEKFLESLKEMLAHYNSEVNILKEVIKRGDSSTEELTVHQVYEMEQKLYGLELTGKAIKESVELSRYSSRRMCSYAETPLLLSRKNPPKRLKVKIMDKVTEYKNLILQNVPFV